MDLLSNMLALINLGYINRKLIVRVKRSKLCIKILKLLYNEGFIRGFSFSKEDPYEVLIFLKYSDGDPIIKSFKRISTTGKRVFINSKVFLTRLSNEGLFILSTSCFGLISSTQLFKKQRKKSGGEVLFKINF